MSQPPFSFLNFFSLSSFKGFNWFEGLKRIKIFLQWLWGVPAGLGAVGFFGYNFLHGSLNYNVLILGIVILLPILGCELLFRAAVWIVAGFLHSGDSKSQAVEMAQAYSSEESKKKINKLWMQFICDLKNTRLREIFSLSFGLLWFLFVCGLIARTSLSPISHWQEGGLSSPLQNLDLSTLVKLSYFLLLTLLKILFGFIIMICGAGLYETLSSKILKKFDSVKEDEKE